MAEQPDPEQTPPLSGRKLRARYGDQVTTVDTEMALQLLGRPDIDPGCAIAYEYSTREVFDLFAEAHQRDHGHETLGPVIGPGGTLYGVTVFKAPQTVNRDLQASSPRALEEKATVFAKRHGSFSLHFDSSRNYVRPDDSPWTLILDGDDDRRWGGFTPGDAIDFAAQQLEEAGG
jgi:hypothetical protein